MGRKPGIKKQLRILRKELARKRKNAKGKQEKLKRLLVKPQSQNSLGYGYVKLTIPEQVLKDYPNISNIQRFYCNVSQNGEIIQFTSGCLPTIDEIIKTLQ